MMNQNQFTEEHLIVVIRRDCLRLAQTAQAKLSEVVECLGDENHLGALGSFANLDEDEHIRRIQALRADIAKHLVTARVLHGLGFGQFLLVLALAHR